MNDLQTTGLTKLAGLADKLAMELIFAEAGKDNGLLPTNSFVGEMEDVCKEGSLPAPAVEAVAKARAWIDEIFASTGLFSAEQLKCFSAWVPWMQQVVSALQSGKALPPWVGGPVTTATPEAAPAATAKTEPDAPKPEQVLTLNIESDAELLREFVNESHEHLTNIENGVLVLEDNPSDKDTLNSIFRAFHTFKGGSGFLNLIPINKLAHELETLLDLARQNKIIIGSEVIEVILNGGDTLKQFMIAMNQQLTGQTPAGPILIPTQKLLRWITNVVEGKSGGAAPVEAKPAPTTPAAAAVPEPLLTAAPEEAPAQKAEEPPSNIVPLNPNAAPAPAAKAANSGGSSVKVDTLKLDSLIDLVGEMVIAQSLVAQDTGLQSALSQRLTRNLAQLGRVTKELQRTAMSLRMVPVKATFQKMTRLVRDLCIRSGKQVDLVMSGEDSELDRTIVEEIGDPLVHMMRNSMDHGIEMPEVRTANGKQPNGTIHLAAFHQGGNFVIQIKDDGAGLNKDRILKKAIEKGLVDPNASLSEKEIFALIFAAGFSTAEKITDLSGRGVGMDVVRRNIEKLRGKVEIESVQGKGTTFSIFLPLTLAIIDGMIVRVGEDRYIIPTLSVRESFRPSEDMLTTVHERGEIIKARGRLLPLLRLKQHFSGEPDTTNPAEAVVIVVESDDTERCLLVDELIGKQEVVIKSLGETFKANPLLAGAAILGDGRVGLILDVNSLVHMRPNTLSKAA